MRAYERHGTVNIEPILEKINEMSDAIILGKKVKLSTTRVKSFLYNGTNCVCCGIEGKYFAVERSEGHEWSWHLNLYALNSDGEEVLMTRDHAVLRSKGGRDLVSNYKTMCIECNNLRGSWFDVQEEFINSYADGSVYDKIKAKKLEQSEYMKTVQEQHVLEFHWNQKKLRKQEKKIEQDLARENFLKSLTVRKK